MMKKYVGILICLLCVLVACNQKVERQPLQIVFTNDSHSQVEPLKGKGGFEARAAIIDSLRRLNENTILLDAGDMWQGTPYFNLFKGRKTPLASLVKPYTVINQNGWRVGVIGVSVNPDGLILQSNIEGITYKDPIVAVNRYAEILKRELGCDYIIVLSHLGLYDDTIFNNVSDSVLIANASYVDLVLGGHTHQYNGVFDFIDAEGDTVPAIQECKAGQKIYSITIK